MPRPPVLPPGTRCFGHVHAAHFECPACGALALLRKDPRALATQGIDRRLRRVREAYNPITCHWECPHCRFTFAVGLLLWPVSLGGHAGRPADTVPTRRQAAELRRLYGFAYWPDERKGPTDEVNLVVQAECTCPPVDGGWAGNCPIHGRHVEREWEK